MEKRRLFILGAAVILFVGCQRVQTETNVVKTAVKNEYQGYTQENIPAKLIEFKDIKDLESQTENILRVRKERTLEQIPWQGPDAGDVEPGFETGTTRSEAVIEEVFKGDLKKGDKIQVEEDYFRNDTSKKIFALEGYAGMKEGEEYLLLLNKNEDYYYIVGVLPGQVPIEGEETGVRSRTAPGSGALEETAIINSEYPEEVQNLQIELSEKYLNH